ncbi:MAG: cadherin domain-containing protein, partial [Hyphomicrobium sp.]
MSTGLVIHEIYGGGGTPGGNQNTAGITPTFTNDFVVLYNPTGVAISLTNVAVQIQNGPGTGAWTVVDLSSAAVPVVAAYSYFLVQMGTVNSTLGGAALPTPDFIATIALGQEMGFQNGKVALTSDTSPLNTVSAGVLTSSASIIDLAGYGNGNVVEGTVAPAPSTINSIFRNAAGGIDTNVNSADFATHVAAPHYSASPADDTGAPTFTSAATAVIPENTTAVATASATDVEANALTYSILLPAGSNGAGADGAKFSIDPATGALSFIAAPDFEAPGQAGATANEYKVTVRVTDSGSSSRDQLMTVTVSDANDAPSDISLSAAVMSEFAANGAVIGNLASVDPDAGDTATYTLVGSDGRFDIVGNQLRVANGLLLDFEQAASHSVTVRVTDSGGLTFDKAFVIAINDVNPEAVFGDANANTFVGGAGNDVFGGGGNVDALFGNGGADWLDGGTGTDVMSGGDGNDIYVADMAGDVASETNAAAAGGIDSVIASATFTLGANIERLFLTGAQAIGGTGNTLSNLLDGSANTAANTLKGLRGNDIYIVGAGDIIDELGPASGGIDTIFSNKSYNLGNALTVKGLVENLLLTGTLASNGFGNTLANTITGNGAANILAGGQGNDRLTGGAGGDSFVFNTGLNAASNRDTIVDFNVAADTIKLENAVFKAFAALATGATIGTAAFHSGAGAVAAHD